MYKPSTYLAVAYFLTYLPTRETYFLQNWLTRWNQILTPVQSHPQLSNNGHPVDGALMGAGSLWLWWKVCNALHFNALQVTPISTVPLGRGVELADRNWRFPQSHSLCSYFCGAAVPRRALRAVWDRAAVPMRALVQWDRPSVPRRALRTVGPCCRREYSYPGQYSGGPVCTYYCLYSPFNESYWTGTTFADLAQFSRQTITSLSSVVFWCRRKNKLGLHRCWADI